MRFVGLVLCTAVASLSTTVIAGATTSALPVSREGGSTSPGAGRSAWIPSVATRRSVLRDCGPTVGALVAYSAALLTHKQFFAKTLSSTKQQPARLRGGAAGTSMSLVDSAVHVWKADPKYPFAEGVTPPAKDATPEALLEMMDKNDVAKTVIVQPICYKYDNSFVLDTIKKWPDRFAAVARVDPEDEAAVDKINALTKEGFIGVRFGPVQRSWWEAPLMLKMLRLTGGGESERAAELQVPVLLFLGPDGPKTFEWLLPVLAKVPSLRVVIDHMADTDPRDPEQVEALLSLAELPNVLVKVSHIWALSKEQYPWSDSMAMVKKVVAAFGPQRVMMASDWPVCQMPSWPGGDTDYDTVMRLFKEEFGFLSAEEREGLMGATANKIWWKGSA